MKPHEETWTVVGCGDSTHGPEWQCWKVHNEHGTTVLHSVNRATAERYAAFPAIARALLATLDGCSVCFSAHTCRRCAPAYAALKEAGVLE